MDEQSEQIRVEPKAIEKKAQPGFDSSEALGRIDKLETSTKDLNKGVKDVRETNHLLVIVLVGIILVLLFTLAIAMISALKDDTTSRDQLIQEVQQMNDKLNK